MLSWVCFICPSVKLRLLDRQKPDSLYQANEHSCTSQNATLTLTNAKKNTSALMTNNTSIYGVDGDKLTPTSSKSEPNDTKTDSNATDCPKSTKPASTTQKERRKFRKLRLSSFRKHIHSSKTLVNNSLLTNTKSTNTVPLAPSYTTSHANSSNAKQGSNDSEDTPAQSDPACSTNNTDDGNSSDDVHDSTSEQMNHFGEQSTKTTTNTDESNIDTPCAKTTSV